MKFIVDYGTEGIDFQSNSSLGKDLEKALEELRGYSNISRSAIKSSSLSSVIAKHTGGLKVDFEVDVGEEAYVMVPDLNHNSVLFNKLRKNSFTSSESKTIIERKGFIDGTINLKTGKISGDYTELVSTIGLGIGLLLKGSRFSIQEVTAIILHELGHIFSYLEFIGRVAETNYIVNEAVARLLKAETKEQRTVILSEVEKVTKTTLMKKDEIAVKARSSEAYAVVVLSQVVKQSEQELDINIYDARSWEQLADQFAARHGYARYLATGLDKLFKLSGHHQYRSKLVHIFLEAVKFILYGLGGPTIWVLILLITGNPLREEYHSPKERFITLKQQINDALKDTSLSIKEKQKYLDDYEVLEDVIGKLNDNITVYDAIWSVLTPWGRIQARKIKEQYITEGMLNNDLHAIAALLTL